MNCSVLESWAATEDDISTAVSEARSVAVGHARCVTCHGFYGIVVFAIRLAFRPVVFWRAGIRRGVEYMIASESVALQAMGFTLLWDVEPGEAVCIQ